MREIILYIEAPDGRQRRVALENEITIGRTAQAQIALDDAQLSRVHATIWREGDDVWIQDENSTNGTFVNGERIFDERKLNDRDEILLGTETAIFLEISANAERGTRNAEAKTSAEAQPAINEKQTNIPQSAIRNPQANKIPTVPLLAGLGILGIVFFTVVALLLANFVGGDNNGANNSGKPTPQAIRSGALIPVRVVDPLGGEDPEDLDDLIALFEVEEKELKAEDIGEVKSTSAEDTNKPSELNVSIEFWQKQRNLVYAPRTGPTGISPPGMEVPPELRGDGVVKQKAKLAEMMRGGYQQPMDFAELAQKRLSKELIELPMATESFLLDVGGSATEGEFTAFSFQTRDTLIAPGTPKHQTLLQLAGNFDGQKYDLNNGRERKQMRIRLLRMFHPRARPILKELADAYFQQFKRPLRVTSLTRSMDYQISLNKTNANSFIVRGPGSLPPHTSGCAFDLGRAYMTVAEQNFLMKKLAEMENRGVLDALIEYNVNACFHVFIYPDGKPPGKM